MLRARLGLVAGLAQRGERAVVVAQHHGYADGRRTPNVFFDYFSPTDFKFAGINAATNKLEMGGHRSASGWVIDASAAVPGGVRDSQF